MRLRKTTIVIWSREEDYQGEVELVDLAMDATSGLAYCSKQESALVDDAENDPDWDGTEFFNDMEDE